MARAHTSATTPYRSEIAGASRAVLLPNIDVITADCEEKRNSNTQSSREEADFGEVGHHKFGRDDLRNLSRDA